MTVSFRFRGAIAGALFSVVVVFPEAFAQASDEAEWQQGTALSLFGGGASTSSDTAAVVGVGLAWEMTPRFTIDGNGVWVDGPNGATAFAAVLGSRVNLLPRRTAVPFLSGGVGLYRVSFGADNTGLPAFYRRRLAAGLGLARGAHEFTDFAVAIGGGVEVFLRRHLMLSPDVRVLLVSANSSLHTVTVLGVHLSYHFESHNVTPSRRRAE